MTMISLFVGLIFIVFHHCLQLNESKIENDTKDTRNIFNDACLNACYLST